MKFGCLKVRQVSSLNFFAAVRLFCLVFALGFLFSVAQAQFSCDLVYHEKNSDLQFQASGLRDPNLRHFFEKMKEEWDPSIEQKVMLSSGGRRFLNDLAEPPPKPTGRLKMLFSFVNFSAIRNYTRDGFIAMNRALRSGLLASDPACPGCEKLVKTLDRLPSYNGYVFRSIADLGPLRDQFNATMKEGNIFVDPAFVSTSRTLDGVATTGWGNDSALLVIRSRTGRSIEKASSPGPWGAEEAEVLFKPGTSFRVEMVVTIGDDVPLILLTEVQEP
jgi:hypothetical protein